MMCKEFGVLPQAGGVLDQNSYLMYGLEGCIVHYAEKQRLEHDKIKREAEAKANKARIR